MLTRKSGRIQAKAKDADPVKRVPLADITSNSLNQDSDNARRASTSKRQKVSQNESNSVEIFQNDFSASQESTALSEATIESAGSFSDPVFSLTIQRTISSAQNMRPRALWSFDTSNSSLFTEEINSLPDYVRYVDIIHPTIAENPMWVVDISESIYTHNRALEKNARYKWDLSYVPILKKATGTDRAELVDSIVSFSTRARLKLPTLHLAVLTLDRYLAALLCPSRHTTSARGSASSGIDEVVLSEEAQEILTLPHALKCITGVCIWLAAQVEERQHFFNPAWLLHELFMQVPVAQQPSQHRLARMQNLVAQTLHYDLNAPTTYSFLCHLVPLAGFQVEDVRVVRCLLERVLLEDPTSTNTTSTTTNTTTVLGVFPPSVIAASCVLLARALKVHTEHAGGASTANSRGAYRGNRGVREVVWTAELRRFSGYTAAELRPCTATLLRMLQQETYTHARLYAHSLRPRCSYTDFMHCVTAMLGTNSGGGGGGNNGSSSGDPLRAYLAELPSVFSHLQHSLVQLYGVVTHTKHAIHPTHLIHTTHSNTARTSSDTHTTKDTASGVCSGTYTPVVFPTTAELRGARVNTLCSNSINTTSTGVTSSTGRGATSTPVYARSVVECNVQSVFGVVGSIGVAQSVHSKGVQRGGEVVVPTPVRSLWMPAATHSNTNTNTNTNTKMTNTHTTTNTGNTNTSHNTSSSTSTIPVFRIFGQGVFNNTYTTTNTNIATANDTSNTTANTTSLDLNAEYSQLSQHSQPSCLQGFSQVSQLSEVPLTSQDSAVESSAVSGSMGNSGIGGVNSFGGMNLSRLLSFDSHTNNTYHPTNTNNTTNNANNTTTNTYHPTYPTNNTTSTSVWFDPYRTLYSQDGYSNHSVLGGGMHTASTTVGNSFHVNTSTANTSGAVFGCVSALSSAPSFSTFLQGNTTSNTTFNSTSNTTSNTTLNTTFTRPVATTTVNTSSNTGSTTVAGTTATPARSVSVFAAFTEPKPRNNTVRRGNNITNNTNTTSNTINTTASNTSNTNMTPSVLGKRQSAFSTINTANTTPATNTSIDYTPANTTNTTVVRSVALPKEAQHLYKLYPPDTTSNTICTAALSQQSNNTITTTTTTITDTTSTTNITNTTNTTNNTDTTHTPGILDYSIAHTTQLPTVRYSVRKRYIDVYHRLVSAPPL